MFQGAAAKSLQLCLTLCDPIDGSPPGSSVPGILQARILDWVANAFSDVSDYLKISLINFPMIEEFRGFFPPYLIFNFYKQYYSKCQLCLCRIMKIYLHDTFSQQIFLEYPLCNRPSQEA